jgi:hypothetical protein
MTYARAYLVDPDSSSVSIAMGGYPPARITAMNNGNLGTPSIDNGRRRDGGALVEEQSDFVLFRKVRVHRIVSRVHQTLGGQGCIASGVNHHERGPRNSFNVGQGLG